MLEKRLNDFNVRIVDSNMGFVKQNEQEIEAMLFLHSATECIFKIAVASGFKQIEIGGKKEFYANDRDEMIKFMYAFHNWFLLVNSREGKLMLYKIEY